MKSLMSGILMIATTLLAAIALVLPWNIRCKFSALLRWFRDLLMQNSQGIRRWALKARWSWGSDEQ